MNKHSPDQIFDELLLMQYREGDQQALVLLIRRWNPKILAYADRIVQEKQAAKDVAQEVWISVIKGLHQLLDEKKMGSWLLGITHNKAIDWLNKKKTPLRETVMEREEQESTNGEENTQLETMRAAIKRLTPDQQQVLTLFYLEEYSLQEISDDLAIPKGTVKSRLFYARESLKKEIKMYNHER